MIRLPAKVATVTAGAHGIGRAIAEIFTEAGAQVVVADIDEEAGRSLPRFVRADVSSREDAAAVVAAAAAINGRIDVLCNNAAYLGTGHAALDATDEEWERSFSVSLLGAQHFTRAVLPHMIAQRSGSIVNISSVQGIAAARNSAAYTSVKHGLIGFTRSVAYGYGPYNIRANAICPGCDPHAHLAARGKRAARAEDREDVFWGEPGSRMRSRGPRCSRPRTRHRTLPAQRFL